MKPLIIGTRGSPLALAQAEIIKKLLQAAHPGIAIETKIIKTTGDLFPTASLTQGAGKGLFTKEIEEQLLAGTITLAVHSLKDLPTTLPAGLTIGAIPAREDAHDLLVTKQSVCSLMDLPTEAIVATSSIRRRAQLLAIRPDLHIEDIRGNIETRLRRLQENDRWSATVLAAAGIRRQGLIPQWPQLYWHVLDFDLMIPAVGQGAIACEVRTDDLAIQALLSVINDADTRACVEAERSFLRTLGGGCQVPYAAHATIRNGWLHLRAGKFRDHGQVANRVMIEGPATDPIALGERAARVMTSPGQE